MHTLSPNFMKPVVGAPKSICSMALRSEMHEEPVSPIVLADEAQKLIISIGEIDFANSPSRPLTADPAALLGCQRVPAPDALPERDVYAIRD